MDLKTLKRFCQKLERMCKRYHVKVHIFAPPIADYTECYFDDGAFSVNITVWNCNIIEHRHCHREVMQEALSRLHLEYMAARNLLHSLEENDESHNK